MSKIKFEWLTGKRLMERWNLDLRELHMVIQMGLPVYNSNYELEDQGPIYNKTPNPDYKDWFSAEPEYIVEKNNLYDLQVLLETPFPVMNTGLTKNQILSNLLFKSNDVEHFEKEYGPPSKKVKNLRPSQKAKIECRKIAETIWKKKPDITIADMINDSEIVRISKKKDGKFYSEKTVRNWIKDLCPNRLPGRPKKKE